MGPSLGGVPQLEIALPKYNKTRWPSSFLFLQLGLVHACTLAFIQTQTCIHILKNMLIHALIIHTCILHSHKFGSTISSMTNHQPMSLYKYRGSPVLTTYKSKGFWVERERQRCKEMITEGYGISYMCLINKLYIHLGQLRNAQAKMFNN